MRPRRQRRVQRGVVEDKASLRARARTCGRAAQHARRPGMPVAGLQRPRRPLTQCGAAVRPVDEIRRTPNRKQRPGRVQKIVVVASAGVDDRGIRDRPGNSILINRGRRRRLRRCGWLGDRKRGRVRSRRRLDRCDGATAAGLKGPHRAPRRASPAAAADCRRQPKAIARARPQPRQPCRHHAPAARSQAPGRREPREPRRAIVPAIRHRPSGRSRGQRATQRRRSLPHIHGRPHVNLRAPGDRRRPRHRRGSPDGARDDSDERPEHRPSDARNRAPRTRPGTGPHAAILAPPRRLRQPCTAVTVSATT